MTNWYGLIAHHTFVPAPIDAKRYVCSYCNVSTVSDQAFCRERPDLATADGRQYDHVYICLGCNRPTYFPADGGQVPGNLPGDEVGNLPPDVEAIYVDARKAAQAGAFTACVLACRKVLMHVAVEQGAPVGSNFQACVNHLDTQRLIPPNAKGWVDKIRNRSNEANHQIVLMGESDAKLLIALSEMLLKIVYEYPAKV